MNKTQKVSLVPTSRCNKPKQWFQILVFILNVYVIAFSKSVSFVTFTLYIHLKQAELLTDPESQMKC